MRHFLIDGFNLFHKIPEIEDSTAPRRDLISYIRRNNLTGSSNNKVTIVFDGYETEELGSDPQYHILFSEDKTADEIIKDKISSARNKRNLVVVSDDNEIRSRGQSEGANVSGTHEFLAKANSSTVSKRHGDGFRGLKPSRIMDINEELERMWVNHDKIQKRDKCFKK